MTRIKLKYMRGKRRTDIVKRGYMSSRMFVANQAVKFTSPSLGLTKEVYEDSRDTRGPNRAHYPNTLFRSVGTNVDNLSLEHRIP
jgi:hypothetical protein